MQHQLIKFTHKFNEFKSKHLKQINPINPKPFNKIVLSQTVNTYEHEKTK